MLFRGRSTIAQDQYKKRFNQEHYDFLLKCSKSGEIKKWNEFVFERQTIDLEEADLTSINLKGASLKAANLKGAKLRRTNLEDVDLSFSNLEGAWFSSAHIEGANCSFTNLEKAFLHKAHLEGGNFFEANLKGAYLGKAHLERADFQSSYLESADFWNAYIEGTKFIDCHISKTTSTVSTSLDQAQFSPGLKQSLEYNNRRRNWEDWYEENKYLSLFVMPFWWFSDYGRSTARIATVFFGLSLLFAILYMLIPGAIDGLEHYQDHFWLKFIRLCCFSIVTMTTLGFGDITAVVEPFKYSEQILPVIAGHVLITLQVINGYIILGALVTRLSILFNSDGPAHPFEEEKEAIRKRIKLFTKILKPFKYVSITLPTRHPIVFFILYLIFMILWIRARG